MDRAVLPCSCVRHGLVGGEPPRFTRDTVSSAAKRRDPSAGYQRKLTPHEKSLLKRLMGKKPAAPTDNEHHTTQTETPADIKHSAPDQRRNSVVRTYPKLEPSLPACEHVCNQCLAREKIITENMSAVKVGDYDSGYQNPLDSGPVVVVPKVPSTTAFVPRPFTRHLELMTNAWVSSLRKHY